MSPGIGRIYFQPFLRSISRSPSAAVRLFLFLLIGPEEPSCPHEAFLPQSASCQLISTRSPRFSLFARLPTACIPPKSVGACTCPSALPGRLTQKFELEACVFPVTPSACDFSQTQTWPVHLLRILRVPPPSPTRGTENSSRNPVGGQPRSPANSLYSRCHLSPLGRTP